MKHFVASGINSGVKGYWEVMVRKEIDILFEQKENLIRGKEADWSWLSWKYADYRNLDFLKSEDER